MKKVIRVPVCRECPVRWPDPLSGLCGYCRRAKGLPTIDSGVHDEDLERRKRERKNGVRDDKLTHEQIAAGKTVCKTHFTNI